MSSLAFKRITHLHDVLVVVFENMGNGFSKNDNNYLTIG